MASIRDKKHECIKTSINTMWLPIGRLSYPHLLEPKLPPGEIDPKKAKYQTSIILQKTADLRPLRSWIAEAIKDKWGGKPVKIKDPILPHAEKTADQDLAREFPILIRCSSDYKPIVAFPSGEGCDSPEQIYPGRWARVSVRLYPWDHPVGGKGVSIGLSNVVLLDDDTRLGGGRAKLEDEFKGLFDVEAPGEGNRDGSADDLFN